MADIAGHSAYYSSFVKELIKMLPYISLFESVFLNRIATTPVLVASNFQNYHSPESVIKK